MENIIINGEVKVTFTTGNVSYDEKLKKLVLNFMDVKKAHFINECVDEGLIKNTEPVIPDYSSLEKEIGNFFKNKVECKITPIIND